MTETPTSTSTETTWPYRQVGEAVSNWGRWGADDEIGTLNHVTDAKRVAAARLVRTGKAIDLGIPFDKEGPFKDGGFRSNPQHIMTLLPSDTPTPYGLVSADDMVVMGLQAATQWDSLAHVGYDGVFYNGVPAAAVNSFTGASRNSFAKSVRNLISRGVLLDIAALKGVDVLEDSYEITSADLAAAEERQGVRVESGDILLLRTGWIRHFHAGDRKRFLGPEAGPGLEAVPWLHEREVAALAVDNSACEVSPSCVPGVGVPFHQVAIRDMGLLIGEMFDFEELAADCAADGVWECLFTGTGLNITGSVGSPLTPMALK